MQTLVLAVTVQWALVIFRWLQDSMKRLRLNRAYDDFVFEPFAMNDEGDPLAQQGAEVLPFLEAEDFDVLNFVFLRGDNHEQDDEHPPFLMELSSDGE